MFNIILDTAIFPESWLIDIIKPNFKSKGDASMAENYRPKTIVSCMGRHFTAVLNNRLQMFL